MIITGKHNIFAVVRVSPTSFWATLLLHTDTCTLYTRQIRIDHRVVITCQSGGPQLTASPGGAHHLPAPPCFAYLGMYPPPTQILTHASSRHGHPFHLTTSHVLFTLQFSYSTRRMHHASLFLLPRSVHPPANSSSFDYITPVSSLHLAPASALSTIRKSFPRYHHPPAPQTLVPPHPYIHTLLSANILCFFTW